jgi:osmotically-inducible protein OsmY
MTAALVALAFVSAGCSTGEDRAAKQAAQKTPAPDNTATNERDRSGAELTPVDQGGSDAELAITQDIRQRIAANDALSMNGKNVKVITSGSVVTLRGPIDTNDERIVIVNAAQGTRGVTRVDDQLELVAPQGT